MKKINTGGIFPVDPLEGSSRWYWGMDYTGGDLYEAGQLFRNGDTVRKTRLIFLHYPDGKLLEPLAAAEGEYFGKPVFCGGRIYMLTADFLHGQINIISWDPDTGECSVTDTVPMSEAGDCYNLMFKTEPLMLTMHPSEGGVSILWPKKQVFNTESRESLDFGRDGKLYFTRWYEDPDYREEVIVRDAETGEVIERIQGTLMLMPGGESWILQ